MRLFVKTFIVFNILTGLSMNPCDCPPGMHVLEPCNEESISATCQTCPAESFKKYSSAARTCKLCKTDCVRYKYQVLTGDCTRIHDRECVCEYGMYFSLLIDRCQSWTKCPRGQGVSVNGTHLKNVECSNCDLGYFSNVSSSTEACRPCQKCLVLLEKCTNQTDAVCSTSQYANDDSNPELSISSGVLSFVVIVGAFISVYFCCWKGRQKSTEGLEIIKLPQGSAGAFDPQSEPSPIRTEEEDCMEEIFWFCSKNMAFDFHNFFLHLPGEQAWQERENSTAFKQVQLDTKPGDSYGNFIVKALKTWAERNPHHASPLNVYKTIRNLKLCDVQNAFEKEFPEFKLKQESYV